MNKYHQGKTQPIAFSDPLPLELRQFADTTPWTFAKTYAKTWPHEYIVREPYPLTLGVLWARRYSVGVEPVASRKTLVR